jgi:hypothetical protein
MSTLQNRLDEFEHGSPPSDCLLQVLCADHNGTYLLPFACRWREGSWYNGRRAIEANVVGWRALPSANIP